MRLKSIKFNYWILVVLFFLNSTVRVTAQNNLDVKIDSLKKELLNYNLEDIERVSLYRAISREYRGKDLDSSRYFTKYARDLSYSIENYPNVILCIIDQAILEEIDNNIETSISFIDEAFELYDNLDLSEDSKYLTLCNYQGIYYDYLSQYENSVTYYLKGIESCENQNNESYKGIFYNNLSLIYNKTHRVREGLILNLEATELFKKYDETISYYYSLFYVGRSYYLLNDYDLSLEYLTKAKDYFLINNEHWVLYEIYAELGKISIAKKNYNRALNELSTSIIHAYSQENVLNGEDYHHIGEVYNNLGNVYLYIEDYSKAKDIFLKSKSIGSELNSLDLLNGSYKGLYESHLGLERIDSVKHYLGLFLNMNDSLSNQVYNEKIDSLNYNHQLLVEKEKNQKDLQISNLSKRRQQMYFGVISLLLISVLIIITFLGYAQRNKALKAKIRSENLTLEKENLTLKLGKKEHELTSSVLNLVERNEFISRLMDDLKKISFNHEQAAKIKDIIKSTTINDSKKLWTEFELRFTQNNAQLFQKLTNIAPNLSVNDKRLIALIVLNFSTKEISSITYQSPHSIKIARYRLRKKLGLSKNQNLIQFINSI